MKNEIYKAVIRKFSVFKKKFYYRGPTWAIFSQILIVLTKPKSAPSPMNVLNRNQKRNREKLPEGCNAKRGIAAARKTKSRRGMAAGGEDNFWNLKVEKYDGLNIYPWRDFDERKGYRCIKAIEISFSFVKFSPKEKDFRPGIFAGL